VVSLALSDADPAVSWRFVDDPHLLAVLTTRARRLVHVITSADAPPGLVAAYLKYADEPPVETVGSPPRIPGQLRWSMGCAVAASHFVPDIRSELGGWISPSAPTNWWSHWRLGHIPMVSMHIWAAGEPWHTPAGECTTLTRPASATTRRGQQWR